MQDCATQRGGGAGGTLRCKAALPRTSSDSRQSNRACQEHIKQPCLHQAVPPELERQGSMHTPECLTWNPLLQARQHTRHCTHLPQLQPASQNYSTHSLHRDHFFKTERVNCPIQLTGTKTDHQQNGQIEEYAPIKNKKNRNRKTLSNSPDKEFKERVLKILNKLKSRIWELREHFNKEMEM